MALNNPDRLVNAGLAAETVLALQDQLTQLGNATPPSAGGQSLNTSGNCFETYPATVVGNGADTTEDTLATYSLPANALDKANRGIFIYAWGTYANNTNTKAANLYFGSEKITAATGNNTNWALEMTVGKVAANSQVMSMQNITGSTHGGVNNTTGAETDTAAIVIKVTGQNSTSATANSIVLKGMYVTFNN
jgi:hypothetical protein